MLKKYLTNCTVACGEDIEEMVDNATEITLATFVKHTENSSRNELFRSLGYAVGVERGLHIKDDYYVSYWKGFYQGKPCVYLCHSAIEYIFV